MQSIRYHTLGLCVVACAYCSTAVRAQDVGFDMIHMESGRPVRGKIIAMSPTEINVEVRGVEQKIPVTEIRQITFSQEPSQLRRARDLIRQGQLENALVGLNQIDVDRVNRPDILVDLEYYRLYCQSHLAISTGNALPRAATALFNFIKDNPNSHHFYEAVESLGDVAMALGKYKGAVKYYSQLSRAPWPEMQMRGALLEAAALRAEGNFAESLSKYDSVITTRLSTVEANRQKSLAVIGRAVCQAHLGQTAEAIKSVEKIISENDAQDTELFASAYLALGEGYRRTDQPMDAVLAYLHVDLLFYQSQAAHAEALYHLSNLFKQINKPQRAVAARSLLKSRYPGSRWNNLQ